MDNTIQLYVDKEKEIKGYPITSPDRVIDENGVNIKDYVDDAINNAKLEGGDVQVDLSTYAKKTDLHDHSNKTILDSITTSKVNQWDNKSDFSGNYNDLTNKPMIPTKVSELTNDENYLTTVPSEYITESELNGKGYLTEHQDISGKVDKVDGKSLISDSEIERLSTLKNYDDTDIKNTLNSKANKTELHSHNNKSVLDGITTSKISEWNNKSTFNGDYNDLTNKPTIPSLNGYATEQYVNEEIKKIDVTEQLTDYAKKSELHSHSNKSVLDGITSAKITEWDSKSDFSGNYNDLTNKPTIPTKVSDLPNDSGYLTEHQDISGKVDKISGYSLVGDAEISRLATLENYDDTEIRELINEINTSLDNITTEIQSILVRLNDLENATPPSIIYGGIVLSKTATTIIEGESESFTVSLDKAPSNNQIVTISKTNPNVSLSTTTLTFTPTNYNVSQMVTITVSEDSDTTNDTDIITLTSPNVSDKMVSVTITDNDTEIIDNPIDEVSIFVGNRYEPHPQNFLKGYKYILTPQSICTWNNPTTVTTIDLTQEVPTENSKYGSDKQLKGYFKVTTMKNEEIINTPTTFVSTSTPRWYGAVVKRNGKDNVVILGDSLSEQAFVTFKHSYVQQLINKYNSKYNLCTQWAKYGETTDLQMAGITKYVNVHTNANDYGFGIDITLDDTKYVSIFTGTNEINKNVELSTFETNYSNLVDYIKTNLPQAKILCITPYLCCKKASNINYINKIKEIAVAKGCSVCDLSTFTELDSVANGQGSYYLEAECIHLNEAGWNLVTPKIIQAYESLDGFTS